MKILMKATKTNITNKNNDPHFLRRSDKGDKKDGGVYFLKRAFLFHS